MLIQLTKEHEAWLQAQVAAGRYQTLDDAIAEAIEMLKAEGDNDEWARSAVAEGLAELDRGQSVPADEVFDRAMARLRRSS